VVTKKRTQQLNGGTRARGWGEKKSKKNQLQGKERNYESVAPAKGGGGEDTMEIQQVDVCHIGRSGLGKSLEILIKKNPRLKDLDSRHENGPTRNGDEKFMGGGRNVASEESGGREGEGFGLLSTGGQGRGKNFGVKCFSQTLFEPKNWKN